MRSIARQGGGESPRGALTRHTFCHPWKYESRRFVKESSVRVAREPGPPPDHDSSAQECLVRGLSVGGKWGKNVKRWWTGSKPSPETPIGSTRVSDADPLLSSPVTTSAAFHRNGDPDGPHGLQVWCRTFSVLLFRAPSADGDLVAFACIICLPPPRGNGKPNLIHLRL